MLLAILGYMGAGKTLMATILAQRLSATCKIVANFQLNIPNFEFFDLDKFLEGQYDNSEIFLDEAYSVIEAREHYSQRNKFASYILCQSRKRNINLIIIAQEIGMIDIRYRFLLNNYIFCEFNEFSKQFEYTFIAKNKIVNQQIIKYEEALPYFELYNTNELIIPESQKVFSKASKQIEIKRICSQIKKYFQISNPTIAQIDLYKQTIEDSSIKSSILQANLKTEYEREQRNAKNKSKKK